MSRLHRALIRDLWHLRGQVIATALVVSVGIGAFVTMVSTYQSLARARADYYSTYRFADVFASLKRAPDSLAATLRLIPGVAAVQTRVAEDVILSVPGLAEPATGRLISLSSTAESGEGLNRLYLTAGRYPSPRSDDEIVASQTFARADSLSLGSRIGAVLNGRWKVLRVVGLALSPEYVYEVGPGMVVPDNRRFGVLWMNSEGLATAFNMKGAFNDVSLSLARGASSSDVIDAVDRLLAPYGGFKAYDRYDQPSNRFLTDELGEIEVNATYIPAIFLAVAVFLVYTLLARLTDHVPALDPARLRARRRERIRTRWATAAMVLLSIGLGGVAGWQARSLKYAALSPPMADAVQAYRMFTRDQAGHFDFVSEHHADLQAWMGAHFAGAPSPPDLAAAGFHPVGARLVATADGPAGMVLYVDARGEAITFYVRPPSPLGILPSGQRREGDLIAEYGSANGYDFAFVSRVDPEVLQALHRAVRSLT